MPSYNNHLSKGYLETIFKDKRVASSLNSSEFEASIALLRSQPFSVGIIPPSYEHRADKIADLFYGSPTLDWVVLWTNNISDPFEQLNVGDRIKIVSLT
jgi:hypothetical protein|tara:strand:+ start:1837 stop:2133 length:297 start_codon:yes stop_codon:yes gene_type:complete